MPKFRSRRIVSAEQWFPGSDIEGIRELKDGNGFFESEEKGHPLFNGRKKWGEIKPGDWIISETVWEYPADRIIRYVRSQKSLDDGWENIGG